MPVVKSNRRRNIFCLLELTIPTVGEPLFLKHDHHDQWSSRKYIIGNWTNTFLYGSVSLGLPQLTRALAHIDSGTCGAAYISATLVCYCNFAAGPAPGDLLACNLDIEQDVLWVPMVHGVRLIREKFDDDKLFTGLMEPMHRRSFKPATEVPSPRCKEEDLPRLDWEKALKALRSMVVLHRSDDAAVCLGELDKLIPIYEATFGVDEDGSYHGPPENQFVFGWLYRLQRPFISCLQQKDSRSLIILAYFAVLLKTMEHLWYIKGWADHLVAMVKNLTPEEDLVWLQWPSEALSFYDRCQDGCR